MFWPCPFVRTSVRLFVRLLPNCERYTSKTNEPISMTIGTNLPRKERERSTSGGQEVKDQGHRRSKFCLEAWQRRHSRSLESSR